MDMERYKEGFKVGDEELYYVQQSSIELSNLPIKPFKLKKSQTYIFLLVCLQLIVQVLKYNLDKNEEKDKRILKNDCKREGGRKYTGEGR